MYIADSFNLSQDIYGYSLRKETPSSFLPSQFEKQVYNTKYLMHHILDTIVHMHNYFMLYEILLCARCGFSANRENYLESVVPRLKEKRKEKK